MESSPGTRRSPDVSRQDLLRILGAALRAVDPTLLVAQALADEPRIQEWSARMAAEPPPRAGERSVAGNRGRTLVLAVGKAALGMTRGALHVLGDQVDAGIVVIPSGDVAPERPDWLLPQFALHRAAHPVPDEAGAAAARAVRDLAGEATARDRVLVLLSGGASALLPSPVPGITLEDLREVGRILLASGLGIRDTNRVRGVLEELKAGGLARHLRPADVLGLVLSDVPGDDPAVVGSGPLHPGEDSARDVAILLRREGLWESLPPRVQALLESRARDGEASSGPAGEPLVRIVGGGDTATDAALRAARGLGYHPVLLTRGLEGEARRAGRGMARAACALQDGLTGHALPACLVASGETTVHVTGSGRGGRNQEVALGAARVLEGRRGVVLAAVGTDGVDGPTDAAGAWVDGETASRAATAGLSIEAALEANDAYPLLDRLGALIRTGPTGTNVADLVVALVTGAGETPER